MRSLKSVLALFLLAATSLLGASTAVADPASTISVSPGSFAFGPINVGGELGEPAEFTVTNTGTVDANLIEAGIAGTDSLSFPFLPNGSSCFFLDVPGVLEPGDSCSMAVIFDPVNEGPNEAQFEIISDAESSPDVMPLTGTGLPRLLPGATFTPQTGEFGEREIGTVSDEVVFTLASTGTGDLNIGAATLGGVDPSQFRLTGNNCSGRWMASGDKCEVRIVFEPESAGVKTATLKIVTNDEEADTLVQLSGTGAEPRPPVGASRIQVLGGKPRLGASGKVGLTLGCEVDGMDACRGRITLRARGWALGLRHNRLVRIGSRAYVAKPGRAGFEVRLSARARRALRAQGRLAMRVTLTTAQGDGRTATAQDTLRIRR